MPKCIQFVSSVAVMFWLVAGLAGCDGPDGKLEEQQAKEIGGREPEQRIASARAAPAPRRLAREVQIASRAPERRTEPIRGRAPGVVRRDEPIAAIPATRPGNLDDALQAMAPHEVIAKLEEIYGPLEGAHYIFERGSAAQLVGERPRSVDGGLSVIDCRLDDPENPASGRTLWIGGLELGGAPEEFGAEIERERTLFVLGYDVQRVFANWRDALISGERPGAESGVASDRTLRGMSRTLDAGIEQEWSDGARTWRRRIEVSTEVPSPVGFRWEGDPCPDEMTLNLVLRDHVQVWELAEHQGEIVPRSAESLQPETIGIATLVASKVGEEPEIVEPAQRALRARILGPGITSRQLPARAGGALDLGRDDALPRTSIDLNPLR
jgi:hypothetical protein